VFDAQPPKSRVLAGRYEIQSTLGRGGMGVVYQALDLETRRPVAIKRPARAASETHLQRFRREGEALARLKHPGVVPVLDLGEEKGEPFIVLELVRGHSLEEVLRGRGELPEVEVLELGRCLAEALAYAHERDVLHRDVKPDNVLLPRADQPVLVDFGLAKFEEASGGRLTATGALAGTPGFAAPEQLADAGRVDALADVYGLGATLYALLTGGPPGGSGPAVNLIAVAAAGSFPSPRSLRSEISRELDALVMRALAFEPSERFPNMAEFADAIAALERARRDAKGSRRGKTGLVVGVLAISFGGGVGLTAALSQDESLPSPAVTVRPELSPTEGATPAPSSLPAPALEGAAAKEAEAALLQTLLELQQANTAIAGSRFEAFSAAVADAERISAPSPPQALLLGRAYRELARWEDAIRAYQQARQPGFEVRAELGRGLTHFSRLDGSQTDQRAWIRQGREALASAASQVVSQPPGLERGAGLLAELGLRLWDLPRGIEVSGTSNRVRAVQEQIPADQLLLRQELHFAISFGLRKSRALSVAGTRLEALEPAPPPMWSPGYALPLVKRFALMGLSRDSLQPSELLVSLVRGRGGSARRLAGVQAKAGLAGGVERSLGAPEAGFSEAEMRRLRQKTAEACRKAGRLLGVARTAGAYRFRLEPKETDVLLWVEVPEGTGALEVSLQGAEADLDLYAQQDGAPPSGTPWRSDDLTHAEFLRIDQASKPKLRPGVVQVRLNRYRSYPEPVIGVIMVEHRPLGEAPRPRWRNAWEVSLNGAPKDLRPVLGRAHELFLAGRTRELEASLRPHQARVPRLALLRTKFLLGLGEIEAVSALAAELDALGQPHPLPLRYAMVPVTATGGDLKAAVALADEILSEEPDLLELALMAARFEFQAGQSMAAQARLEALLLRDPRDLRITSLLLTFRAWGGEQGALDSIEGLLRSDPAALLYDDQMALLVALAGNRPEVADEAFEQIRARAPKPTPSQTLEFARYLIARRRPAEAQELIQTLDPDRLAPANRREAVRLARSLSR
jgi:serine/threonine protein kinase